jgi:hypothetical protein
MVRRLAVNELAKAVGCSIQPCSNKMRTITLMNRDDLSVQSNISKFSGSLKRHIPSFKGNYAYRYFDWVLTP